VSVEQQDGEILVGGRRRRVRRALLLMLALLVLALLGLWLARERLATGYIDGELARRGVTASYEATRIGLGTQIFENLVIGDPAHPDATAERVEVGLRFGLAGPSVGLIKARGVRLYGRVVDGRLSFGQIDRLLPPPSGAPFRLPDQRIDVADAAILLDTPAGRVALGLTGRGNLSDGFRGSLAGASRLLRVGDCQLVEPRLGVAVGVDDLSPHLRGPAAARRLRCGTALDATRPLLALDATFAPALDSWRGRSAVRVARLGTGTNLLTAVEGRFGFAGDRRQTGGTLSLRSGASSVAAFEAGVAGFDGRYTLSLASGAFGLDGDLSARGLRIAEPALRNATSSLRGAAATPVGPIGEQLAAALIAAGRNGAEAQAGILLDSRSGSGSVRLSQLRAESRSGAHLAIAGGDGLAYAWPGGGLDMDGTISLSGGGFPNAQFDLAQSGRGAPLTGRARIAPIQAGGARLALGEIRFSAAGSGQTRFATNIVLDGPFSGGRVTALALPVSGRFGRSGLTIGESCVGARFASLQVQNLRLGPASLPLCPTGPALIWQSGGRVRAGASIGSPRFAGRLGSSPVTLAASSLRVDLDGFAASALAARLGPAASVNRLDVASLSGRFGNDGVAGPFAGLSGDLANVPLLVGEGSGQWQFRRGRLDAQGHVRVADKQDPLRFHPLVSDDFHLILAGNRIEATGWLAHPEGNVRVMQARILHDLGTGAGNAVLDVPALAFNQGFQPDRLTPLTVGIVASVDGRLSGQGRIEWDAAGTRSTGTFSTEGMNLAAPFGPVEGLTTTVRFTDLLGLTSAPGQEARIGRIQAGVDVLDGSVRYQLRPNYHVAIEGARWPFSGGQLDLEPTVLDFSHETTKYITFRVTGLDAARFIEQMEFSNISATGTFDGTIPMQFDHEGTGRIVGGQLAAREEGGTLSYVGELSDRDLGAYGILAFNALKSLRYNRFALTLDGDLDGEFITVIDLDGVARDPAGTTLPSGGGITALVAGRVFRQISRIPFEFNIRIQGQFRSLIATARSFNDPTPLLQSVLPQLLRDRQTIINDVQDEESEPVR
jgi:translocation and assembly module TamB